MDYYKIGQKIRKYRKKFDFSQEQLAEKVGISVTHMSHIETGNTKLSLPVLVDIVLALGVSADELLFDSCTGKEGMINSILNILSDCSEEELCFFNEMAGATKKAFRKHKK